MIKCPECQKEVSDTAANCPNCGCPLLNETEAYGSLDDCIEVFNQIKNKKFKKPNKSINSG